MIHLSNPTYFWITASVSIGILFLNFFTLKRTGIFRRSDIARIFMWSAVLIFLGMAASNARLEWKKNFPVKEQMEIIFALDVSLSSLAQDVILEEEGERRKISRLEFAKRQIENAINDLKSDAVGIIVFADKAVPLQIALPREDYKNTILRNLRYIDKEFVRYGIKQGTDYGNMIMSALEQFKESPAKKVLLVLTDGEPQGEETKLRENLENAIELFSERSDITVYFIGIGDSRQPSPIPKVEDEDGRPKEFYRFGKEPGSPLILTRPNPEFLAGLANLTGGYFFEAQKNEDLKNIIKNALEKERRIIGFQEKTEMIDLTPVLLIWSLIFLFVIPVIKSV